MREIELSAGSIEYEDTGGNDPVVVLLHGFLMDASLWKGVIADLSVYHRCLAPTLGAPTVTRCALPPTCRCAGLHGSPRSSSTANGGKLNSLATDSSSSSLGL